MAYIITPESTFKGFRFFVRDTTAEPGHERGGAIVATAKTRVGAERKRTALLKARELELSPYRPAELEPIAPAVGLEAV